LVYLPSPRSKNLDTLLHSLLGTLHAGLVARPALLHYHGRGNAVFLPLAWLLRLPAVLWVDGLEWERAKWGPLARWLHQHIADPMVRIFSAAFIADAPSIADYYRRRYGLSVPWIAYGARDVSGERSPDILRRWGLEPGRYALFVGRLTPEKEVHTLLAAFRSVRTDWPLVIVGDNPYGPGYIQQLKALADARVRFLGAQFGPTYRALLADAAVSIHPSRVEGTSPALITALASGCATVVSNIPENVEAAGDAPAYFTVGDPDDLAAALQRLLDDPRLRARHGAQARAWAGGRYSWAAVAEGLAAAYRQRLPAGVRGEATA
jgi:glycosyltransferase involved in cell wall biosynthesis